MHNIIIIKQKKEGCAMEKVYENIKKRRLELDMTQAELAQKCGYKDHTTINKIEKGLVDISIGRLKQIAEVLQIDPIELLGWWEGEEE